MDSLKFHLGPPCLTLLRSAGRQPVAFFYLFVHPHHMPLEGKWWWGGVIVGLKVVGKVVVEKVVMEKEWWGKNGGERVSTGSEQILLYTSKVGVIEMARNKKTSG
jgi:hypothetical protein